MKDNSSQKLKITSIGLQVCLLLALVISWVLHYNMVQTTHHVSSGKLHCILREKKENGKCKCVLLSLGKVELPQLPN